MKVLIVDDNRDDRRMLRYLVEKKGHEALEAEDGFAGLRAAALHVPDLIISDALMPVMDGFEFLRNVKQNEKLRGVPFVFYSASYREYQDVRLAVSLGAEAYIIKPKDPVELWEEIEKIIREGKKIKIADSELIKEDAEYLKQYSRVVASKLEEKVRELEESLVQRKQAESSLAKLAAVSPGLMATFHLKLDGTLCMPYAARRIKDFFGLSPEDVAVNAAKLLARIHPDDAARVTQSLSASARSMIPWNAEFRAVHPTRGEIWLESRTMPEPHPEGGVIWYGFILDITERKRAEEKQRETTVALERQVRFNETLMQAMPVAVFYKDTEGRYLGCNKVFAAITGVAPEDILGKTVFDLWPRERALAYHEQDQQLLKNPSPHIYEYQLENAAGKTTDVLYSKDVFRDENGRVSGIIGVFQDITERKRTETALREREEFIKNILETVDEGFIVVDREYRILSVNRSYARTAGLPEEQVVGRFCYEVSHHLGKPCFAEGADCPVRRTFETGASHTASHTHTDEKGGRQYVEIKSYPIIDASGIVVSVIETINDVTEKKKLEEQLRHAQKLEALGTLAGGVAHDFNNILSVLVGYGALMEMHMDKDDPMLPYLKEMRAATDRATHLTRALLIFGRKQVSELKPVNINELINGMKKMVLRLIGEDIDTRIKPATEQLIVMGDSGQLEQVLMNLATNARDAMPDGGALTLETRRLEIDDDFIRLHGFGKPGPHALIMVSDTGQGMDEETRDRIFEPFFTTKEVGKGTGLGLSIVYGIIEQHNGHIRCYSEPGKGTTFHVYLPAITTTVIEKEKEALPATQGGTETLLIADDDVNVRKVHKELLEKHGYVIIEAEDGADAAAKFSADKDRIALVLLDVIMPKKSGKEAYEEIRKAQPGAKVLFTSGYADDVLQRKRIIEENLEFIQKPVAPRALLAKIREMLDRK